MKFFLTLFCLIAIIFFFAKEKLNITKPIIEKTQKSIELFTKAKNASIYFEEGSKPNSEEISPNQDINKIINKKRDRFF